MPEHDRARLPPFDPHPAHEADPATLDPAGGLEAVLDPRAAPHDAVATKDELNHLTAGLREKERRVLKAVLLEGKALPTVARALGVSPSRVSQIKREVLLKLRGRAAGSHARGEARTLKSALGPRATAPAVPQLDTRPAGERLQRLPPGPLTRKGLPPALREFKAHATAAGWAISAWALGGRRRLVGVDSGCGWTLAFVVDRHGKLTAFPGHGRVVLYLKVPKGAALVEHLAETPPPEGIFTLGSLEEARAKFGSLGGDPEA